MNYKTRKRQKMLLFSVGAIMFFAIAFGAILISPNAQRVSAFDGELTELKLDETNLPSSQTDYSLLTWSDFEYLFMLESNHRSENPEITPGEMLAYLENEIAEIIYQKQFLVSTFSYPTDMFGLGLTSQELIWFVSYPAQGITAYNASKDASTKMKELYAMHIINGKEAELDNVNYNAFKHAYWNALMEKRISKTHYVNVGTSDFPWYIPIEIDFAEGFATAHEHGWDVHFPKSTEMDLMNNDLGRSHGATYKHLSDHDMAVKLAGRIAQGEFWRIPFSGDLNHDRVHGTIVPTNHEELNPQFLFNTTSVSGGVSIGGLIYQYSGVLEIPSSINGQAAVAIGTSAFANQTGISQITIPAGVTSIGNNAFHPNTLIKWTNRFEFKNNQITKFYGDYTTKSIPSFITSINTSAFSDVSLSKGFEHTNTLLTTITTLDYTFFLDSLESRDYLFTFNIYLNLVIDIYEYDDSYITSGFTNLKRIRTFNGTSTNNSFTEWLSKKKYLVRVRTNYSTPTFAYYLSVTVAGQPSSSSC